MKENEHVVPKKRVHLILGNLCLRTKRYFVFRCVDHTCTTVGNGALNPPPFCLASAPPQRNTGVGPGRHGYTLKRHDVPRQTARIHSSSAWDELGSPSTKFSCPFALECLRETCFSASLVSFRADNSQIAPGDAKPRRLLDSIARPKIKEKSQDSEQDKKIRTQVKRKDEGQMRSAGGTSPFDRERMG